MAWWLLVTGIIAIWRRAGESNWEKLFVTFVFLLALVAGIWGIWSFISSPKGNKLTIYAPTPTSTTIPRPAPTNTRSYISGNVILFDNFSEKNNNWWKSNTDAGTVGYKNLGLSIYVSKANTMQYSLHQFPFLEPNPIPDNARIEVDATLVAGTDNNEFGIICRFTDANNFYLFGMSSKGRANIQKYTNGQWVILVRPFTLNSFNQSRDTNHIRADCVRDELTLYVNGKMAATVRDVSFPKGNVGLHAGTFETPGTEILFDNFYVYAP